MCNSVVYLKEFHANQKRLKSSLFSHQKRMSLLGLVDPGVEIAAQAASGLQSAKAPAKTAHLNDSLRLYIYSEKSDCRNESLRSRHILIGSWGTEDCWFPRSEVRKDDGERPIAR